MEGSKNISYSPSLALLYIRSALLLSLQGAVRLCSLTIIYLKLKHQLVHMVLRPQLYFFSPVSIAHSRFLSPLVVPELI